MGVKSAYKLCDKCRKMVRLATLAELRRRKKRGLPPGGRPRKQLDEAVLDAVRNDDLTVEQAAKKLGVSSMTVRRRLQER